MYSNKLYYNNESLFYLLTDYFRNKNNQYHICNCITVNNQSIDIFHKFTNTNYYVLPTEFYTTLKINNIYNINYLDNIYKVFAVYNANFTYLIIYYENNFINMYIDHNNNISNINFLIDSSEIVNYIDISLKYDFYLNFIIKFLKLIKKDFKINKIYLANDIFINYKNKYYSFTVINYLLDLNPLFLKYNFKIIKDIDTKFKRKIERLFKNNSIEVIKKNLCLFLDNYEYIKQEFDKCYYIAELEI